MTVIVKHSAIRTCYWRIYTYQRRMPSPVWIHGLCEPSARPEYRSRQLFCTSVPSGGHCEMNLRRVCVSPVKQNTAIAHLVTDMAYSALGRPPAARQNDRVLPARGDSMATIQPPLHTADRAGLAPGGSARSQVHLPGFLAAPVRMPSTRGHGWGKKTVRRGRLCAADVALASIWWRPL